MLKAKKHETDEREIALLEIAAKVNRARELGHGSITVTSEQMKWLRCTADFWGYYNVRGYRGDYQGLTVYEGIDMKPSERDAILNQNVRFDVPLVTDEQRRIEALEREVTELKGQIAPLQRLMTYEPQFQALIARLETVLKSLE